MEKYNCIGCGAELQSLSEVKPGFVNKSVLEKNPEDILCKRCFKIKNYNQIMPLEIEEADFLKILQKVDQEDALIIKIIDIFDFTGSFIEGLNRHVGGNDVILVGNKQDILPKSVKPTKIVNWMKKQAADNSLKALDATVVSSAKGTGFDKLMEMIEEYRKGRKVYVVGCTNVGKSTFINQIIKKYFQDGKDTITTSKYAGTTLNFIEIPLFKNSAIIDTPGLFNKHQFCHYVEDKTLDIIMPTKEIKPKVFQLNSDQTLFVGGLVRMDFVKGDRTSFICHFSNNLNIHRTKLERATELEEKHIGALLSPPNLTEYENIKETREYNFKIGNEKTDIVISGLGFFTVPGNVNIKLKVFKEIGVFIRKAII